MARLRTAEDLVADVRRRCGLEHSDLLDDPEILELLNQELAELRSHLRRNEGQPHERSVTSISVVAGTALYPLPSDFWEVLGIEAKIGGLTRRVEPFMENERAGMLNAQLLSTSASPMYRLAGKLAGVDQIEFLPSTQTFTATLKYATSEPRLTLGATPPSTVDGYNGYEIAAIYGTCAQVREKEDADPSFYEGRKMKIYALIDANAAQRDAGSPERVTDVTGGLDYDLFSPFGMR